ncbi:MAG: sodium-translocating pyrophosphatase [Tetrasphaera sp.]|nr:sodium-translocating pyrophosphatase [Tetrasphaera sp.]
MIPVMQALATAMAGAAGPAGDVASAAESLRPHSEAGLRLPEFSIKELSFLGMSGWTLLALGLVVCLIGMAFGMIIYSRLRKMPVHSSMLEISELIYATCKTYLRTQARFIAILWAFIATVIVIYFGVLEKVPVAKVAAIALFSVIGILGSVMVAFFGIRINTFANSRTAFASLRGKPYPTYAIPLQAGMSIGTLLISTELFLMLCIMLFMPPDYAGPCFIGFAVGESLGAAALRIAGGIFTKIADIGSDLMKIVFNIKEDDARNPGVIADCTGDNAGDSVGPTADGFETYGVTGVALITFILVAIPNFVPDKMDAGEALQSVLLVWLFAMRITMIIASIVSYLINEALAKAKYANADKMDFEKPLTVLVWLTSFVSIAITFAMSYLLLGQGDSEKFISAILGGSSHGLWWKLASIISCGTLAGAVIPELVKVFTSTNSRHVRETVTASRQGGASLNILAGLTAGNFSGYWMGLTIVALMGIGYGVSSMHGLADLLLNINAMDQSTVLSPFAANAAATVFSFGLVAFGFLGMGPVTIAVDSYGPVTDNAQSVYELSVIESREGISEEIKKDFGFTPDFSKAKDYLEENDGAGNTFKATAKPVLIGTAVVGATTMIFSIIMALTGGRAEEMVNLSLMHPPFLLGLISGGAVIYWFTGASIQAVTTGAYRAVEFIRDNIRLDGVAKASVEDSRKVVEICTQYAQKGMLNMFLGVFFSTLAFAFVEPFFFIGYLISIALFGLYQAIFMANAGGAWDNAKKIVEVDLHAKGTALHDATIVGDTVGDPYKDTSSVALNPVIKFTTLFGLLAVELAVQMAEQAGSTVVTHLLSAVFFVVSAYFVYRSFYDMRIGSGDQDFMMLEGEPERAGAIAEP